jgi:flagellar protein FliO/FliZ
MFDRRRSPRTLILSQRAASALALALALATGLVFDPLARAETPAPQRRPVARAEGGSTSRNPRSEGVSTSGWWMGTAGMALALAACGWASLAARRFLPKRATAASSLRVVGRTSLSPKHSVYLLDVGGRVLIVGTGSQGAPSLLGEMLGDEWIDPSNRAEVGPAGGRLDIRLGESP